MPKVPSVNEVQIPEGKGARRSPAQEELQLALEMLRKGEGVEKEGFLVLELESQKSVASARSALWNLRWKFNPENPECRDKTGGVFKKLFESAGRGGIQVYGSEAGVFIAVPKGYAVESKPATK